VNVALLRLTAHICSVPFGRFWLLSGFGRRWAKKEIPSEIDEEN